jgi:cystathionine beta-lyase/cystathionine gamma-synthase
MGRCRSVRGCVPWNGRDSATETLAALTSASTALYRWRWAPDALALEEAIAILEGATHSLDFASGLAATRAIGYLLDRGDRLLMSDGCPKDVVWLAVLVNPKTRPLTEPASAYVSE